MFGFEISLAIPSCFDRHTMGPGVALNIPALFLLTGYLTHCSRHMWSRTLFRVTVFLPCGCATISRLHDSTSRHFHSANSLTIFVSTLWQNQSNATQLTDTLTNTPRTHRLTCARSLLSSQFVQSTHCLFLSSFTHVTDSVFFGGLERDASEETVASERGRSVSQPPSVPNVRKACVRMPKNTNIGTSCRAC